MAARRFRGLLVIVLTQAACHDRAAAPLTSVQTSALRVLQPIFLASPAEADVAAARVRSFYSRQYRLQPAVLAVLRQAAGAAFTAAPLTVAVREGPLTTVVEPPAALAADARLRLAQGGGRQRPAGIDRPDQPAVVALAAMLPDTRLRSERGVTTHRMASVLSIMVLPVPVKYAREMTAAIPTSLANFVATSRSLAEDDRFIFPGPIAARDAAIADNVTALDTLSPADVAALNTFYASAAGRRYVDELVAVYARANDAAAAAMFRAYLPKAYALASR